MPGRLVKLTLIEDSTHLVVADSEVEADALPDSFLADTTLHIGEEDWSVVEAEPSSRSEYLESGRLVLRLRRVGKVGAGQVLFTLPTIAGEVPPTEGPLLEGSELLLHEDDWRQVELVAATLEGVVDEELTAVRKVLQEAGDEPGFRSIHVRKRLDQPLQGVGLTLEHLRQALPSADESRVVLHDSSHCVTDSFSFFLGRRFALYGLSHAGNVEVLAAKCLGEDAEDVTQPDQVRHLAVEHGLLVVDWCRGRSSAPQR